MTMLAKDIVWGCVGDGVSSRLKQCLLNYFGEVPRTQIKAWDDVTVDDLASLDRQEMLKWPNMGKKTLAHFNQVMAEILDKAYADPTVSLGVKAKYIHDLAFQLSRLSNEDVAIAVAGARKMRELRQALESICPTETPFQRSIGPRHNTMYEWPEVTL